MIISWDEHDMECEYEDHVKSSPFLWQSDTKMEWVTRSSLRSITFLCRTGAVIRALFHGTCSVSKKLAGVVQDVRKVPPPRVPSIPKEANCAWAKEERKDGDIQESVKRFEQRARITGLIPLKSFWLQIWIVSAGSRSKQNILILGVICRLLYKMNDIPESRCYRLLLLNSPGSNRTLKRGKGKLCLQTNRARFRNAGKTTSKMPELTRVSNALGPWLRGPLSRIVVCWNCAV